MLRVTGGEYRGFNLFVPPAKNVRPTANRVREALFNILGGGVEGKKFGDFFAGSGIVGIEAISRGAEFCCFIEGCRVCAKTINRNLQKTGLNDRAGLFGMDITKGIAQAAAAGYCLDYIYVDPPYKMRGVEEILEQIIETGLLADNGLIILERHKKKELNAGLNREIIRNRVYGDTVLSFISIAAG